MRRKEIFVNIGIGLAAFVGIVLVTWWITDLWS